jgi:hypothetical protein
MSHLVHAEFHPDTRDFTGQGIYAVSPQQARSIQTVMSLMWGGKPDNNCSLSCAASLPHKGTGNVTIARHDGRTVVVSTQGVVFTSNMTLYPQHDYTLGYAPPANPLIGSGPNACLNELFPSIPNADILI